ncbi:hypothetical protein niasHT_021230 [Heterodera trifolii]|uniref:Oxysterol-binding protein n=1 Tax=Heterodera trifolii TaxID=157864 RepID=A0ABD2K5V9_9BILA
MATTDWGQFDANGTDYDAIYDGTDDEAGTTDNGQGTGQGGGVLNHLLTQVGPGMTLQNLTLPASVLERRSLLEMYADFFAHPDELVSAAYENTAEKRFLAVLKYYLNSFFPARKSGVAKKPYNPILGETFRCRWTLPDEPLTTEQTTGGPFPGSASNQLTFIAEQVSHHPPISAFYAEHPASGVSCTSYIYTESYIAGLSSLGVRNIGKATVVLGNHSETYTATFPDAVARNCHVTPWFELTGKVEVRCVQTKYVAKIDFLAKPMVFGQAHQIVGQIFHGSERKVPLMTLKGEWNGEIMLRPSARRSFHLFTNVRAKPDVRKECVPVMEQEDNESRKLWRHLTAALHTNNTQMATQIKQHFQQRQRDEEAERKRQGRPAWRPRHFVREGAGAPTDAWKYRDAPG